MTCAQSSARDDGPGRIRPDEDSRRRRPGDATRVLVVEDDEISATILRMALERDGLEVGLEGDGARAAQRLETESWDLVLTDIELPGLGGLELAERARRAPGAPPVLVMSAHRPGDYAGAALDSGAAGFLVKPVDFDELRARIAELSTRSAT